MNSEESLEAFKAAIRAAGGSESAIEGAIEAEPRSYSGAASRNSTAEREAF